MKENNGKRGDNVEKEQDRILWCDSQAVSGTSKENNRSPHTRAKPRLEHTCPDGQGCQLSLHTTHLDTSTTSVAGLSHGRFPQWVRPAVQPGGGQGCQPASQGVISIQEI